MNRHIILLTLTLVSILSAHPFSYPYCIIKGSENPIPGRPYRYDIMFPVGISSTKGISEYRVEVTSGKIMDSNGKFTLTSITGTGSYPSPIIIKWDGAYNNTVNGIIKYYESNVFKTDLIVDIQSSHLLISSKNWAANQNIQYEYQHITLQNIIINPFSNVQINGYNTVRISSGFKALKGSNVRIYNEMPNNAIMEDGGEIITPMNDSPQIQSISENGRRIQYKIPQEAQNSLLHITDMYGNFIEDIPIRKKGENEISIDNSDHPAGIYIYTLIVNHQVVDSKRVMKKQ